MSQFDLTDNQKAIQEVARRFTAEAITPHAARWDAEHHYPKDVVQAAAALGFGSIYVSEAGGGIGLGQVQRPLLAAQAGRARFVGQGIVGGTRETQQVMARLQQLRGHGQAHAA